MRGYVQQVYDGDWDFLEEQGAEGLQVQICERGRDQEGC